MASFSRIPFFDPVYEIIKRFVDVNDVAATGIIIAVVVVLFTALVLLLLGQGKGRRQSVLLVGLCEAGKTLVFSLLVYGKHVDTFTSMKENSGTYQVKKRKKNLVIVDLPGYEGIRARYLDQYKHFAKGIVFLVDSTTTQTTLKDAAEFLYTIFSDRDFCSCPNVLVACNKQDIDLAKSSQVIKTQLEKEMNVLRVTRSAMLDFTDKTSSNNNTFLGKRSKDFEFSHLHPFKVEFVECSASLDDEGRDGQSCSLARVEEWLDRIA